MISDGFGYIALLVALASSIVWVERKSKFKFFDYIPAIVILYFTIMLLSTFGLWQKNPEITDTYKSLKSALLPAMIFLMLLSADLRQIGKLGGKMIFTFILASLSIGLGFIIMFFILHHYFEPDSWKAFAALSGSWMGGTGNMVAIQEALHLPDSKMGYTLLIDSIDYALWVMILLALVPFAAIFNHWSKADSKLIDEVGGKLLSKASSKEPLSFESLFFLLGTSLLVSALCQWAAEYLPASDFLTHSTWIVIIATLSGIVMAVSPLAKLPGSQELGSMMLYIIVALIASRASFYELSEAPLYIAAGFLILGIHLVIMLIFAKIFRLDLFSLGVASLANIGGIASAPILASAYSKALIPIGVLMAMMGYIVGTFGGLLVGKILEYIAQ